MSSSWFECRYVSVVWPDICYFSIYQVKDWSVVDSGTGRLLAWDTCRDRFALLETSLPPRIPIIPKGGSSRKAKEAAAAAAQAAAAAASAASSATVQVRILLDDGTSNVICRSIDGRNEPVGIARHKTNAIFTSVIFLDKITLQDFQSFGHLLYFMFIKIFCLHIFCSIMLLLSICFFFGLLSN